MARLAEKTGTSQTNDTQKETNYRHDENSGINLDGERGPIRDVEKHSSSISGDGLNKVSTEDSDNVVTPKAWLVVVTLAFSYGISFWPYPFFSTIQSELAPALQSSAGETTWITSVYITAFAIAFMICGANSDLFGRRWFILAGHVFVFVGAIIGATSHHIGQSIAGHVLIGFGAGNCQLSAFALPELLPNNWRHIGIVIVDSVAFFPVIAGPVTARIAIRHGDAWRWSYWAVVISIAICFVILAVFYFPPKHPRGIPWERAIRTLDYVGMLSFTAAAAMILSGIVYVQLLHSNSATVVGLLVAGFASLVFFALWETFAPIKEPLTPTRLFTNNKGRTLTAPFVVGFVVTMFYFGCNIIWGTMVSTLFTHEETAVSTVYWLATVQGFGILAGGVFLAVAGNYFQHWKWQMVISITWMTFFGGLLAYVTPEREGPGIAFAFLSAFSYGYAQYLSITYIQFGADQTELGIAGGLGGVARESGGAIAVTVFQTILVNVQTSYERQYPGAIVESYTQGLKTVSLTLMGFGGVAIIACFFLEDIGPKMTKKIEVFLENDVEAHKNKYH